VPQHSHSTQLLQQQQHHTSSPAQHAAPPAQHAAPPAPPAAGPPPRSYVASTTSSTVCTAPCMGTCQAAGSLPPAALPGQLRLAPTHTRAALATPSPSPRRTAGAPPRRGLTLRKRILVRGLGLGRPRSFSFSE
jgi:hypothetical protein